MTKSIRVIREEIAAKNNSGMDRYPEKGGFRDVNIVKIIVSSEHDKEQLLKALHYLHDCYIDTDFIAVNALVHIYEAPELIEVKP